jgi:hypothetical protein
MTQYLSKMVRPALSRMQKQRKYAKIRESKGLQFSLQQSVDGTVIAFLSKSEAMLLYDAQRPHPNLFYNEPIVKVQERFACLLYMLQPSLKLHTICLVAHAQIILLFVGD